MVYMCTSHDIYARGYSTGAFHTHRGNNQQTTVDGVSAREAISVTSDVWAALQFS
jgi:hypothetical protein